MFAFFAVAALLLGLGACSVTDNPASGDVADNPNLPKQGVWTEYDTLLVAAGKNTMEELEAMPGVGMMIKGDKAYFFTYTEDGADNLVEGAITYDKEKGTGTIAFPTIKDSPVSGQTVNFTMISSETMEFELEYEGQKATATCAWLCKDLDNWDTEGDEGDWEELLTYYQNFPADAGPDPSIDWSGEQVVEMDGEEVTVTDLDEPLEWDGDEVAARGGTRMVTAVMEGVSAGLDIFSSLFDEDPADQINAKLDQALGKLDKVLAGQQKMMAKLDTLGARLNAIALKMHQDKILDIFNNRDEKFYNKLKVRNRNFFNDAFDLYNANKNDLSKVKDKLGEYGKEWAGTDDAYVNLTWEYIEHLSSVQSSAYGKGMANIYDGLTFDKYPWEHIGTGDRKSYRAYDMYMIARSLFMINIYAAYGGLSDIRQKGIYDNYNDYKTQLKEFCLFKVSDPNKFRVCQIPGAHFIIHKQLQKYNYCGEKVTTANSSAFGNGCKAPNPNLGESVLYRPEWHEAGNIKIENPKELASKLILDDEAIAIYNYYKAAVYPNNEKILWTNMLVKDKNIADKDNKAGGAIYAKDPTDSKDTRPFLMLHSKKAKGATGMRYDYNIFTTRISFSPLWLDEKLDIYGTSVGAVKRIVGSTNYHDIPHWDLYYNEHEYYAAIVAKRY